MDSLQLHVLQSPKINASFSWLHSLDTIRAAINSSQEMETSFISATLDLACTKHTDTFPPLFVHNKTHAA
jgi:hypothetical protein